MVENDQYPTITLEAENVGSYIYVDDNYEPGIENLSSLVGAISSSLNYESKYCKNFYPSSKEVKRKLHQVYQPSFLFPYHHKKLWLCVNDGMNPAHPDNLRIKGILHEWYSELYPIKSQFEVGASLPDEAGPSPFRLISRTISQLLRLFSWNTLYDYRPLRSNVIIGDLFINYDPNISTIDEQSWLIILLVKNFVFFVLMPIGFLRVYEALHGRRHRIIYKAVSQVDRVINTVFNIHMPKDPLQTMHP